MANLPRLEPLALLLLAAPALGQWETSSGGTSTRDGFVHFDGPSVPADGWSVPQRTEVAIQPVVGEGIVAYARVPDWTGVAPAFVEARDLTTGALLWSTSLPVAGAGRWDAPLAIKNGIVYATRLYNGLADEPIHALDAASGAHLWRSQAVVNTSAHASPAFTSNGDLVCVGRYISGVGFRFLRIDGRDGSTVWNLPAPNGTHPELASLAIQQENVYMVRDLSTGERIERIDPDTGRRMYVSEELGSDLTISHNSLAIAPDGTLLWLYGSFGTPADPPALIAWTDTGSKIVERWRYTTRALYGSTLGVRDDSTVLTISPDHELVLLDLATGAVLRRSWPLLLPGVNAEVRITVDQSARAFVAITGNGGAAGPRPGALLAFDADLELLWARDLGLSPTSGATLADDGRLIVSTVGAVVRTLVQGSPPSVAASVTGLAGSGINPAFLQTSTTPLLGTTWRFSLDPTVVAGTTHVGVTFTAQPSAGVPTRFGEILIDPSSAVLYRLAMPTNGVYDDVLVPVPNDPMLAGLHGYGQGFVLAPSGARVSNALDVELGY